MDSTGYFVTIDSDECRRLIADAVVGRVSWVSEEDGIQVLPVNFVMVGDQIVFRVAQGAILSTLAEPTEVAFQADDLDVETATGWSVMVQGTSGPFEGEVPIKALWAPGRRDLGIAITPVSWSGRSVSADDA